MGWKWRDALSGAGNGAKIGSMGWPIGAVVGAVAGGALGGYGKDIDKGLTGNSQSGVVSGALNFGGMASGGFGGKGGNLPSGAGIMMPGDDDYGSWGEGRQDVSGQDIFKLFQQFQQRNPTDSTSPTYDPMEHAGIVKSRYPFIPDQTFQTWLKSQSPSKGYQLAG